MDTPTHIPGTDRQLMLIDDVIRRLHVSRTMVYRLMRTGTLKPLRIGRLVRFDPTAVDQLIETLAANAEADYESRHVYRRLR